MLNNKNFLLAIGKKVDKVRKEKGLSFQELAYRSDMEKSNLVKFTTKGTNITLLTLYKIAKGLDVSPEELLRFPFHK